MASPLRLPRVLVGLGNEHHDWTRHNIGAELVKAFAKHLSAPFERVTLQRVHALEARSNAAGGVRFVLPGGFINQSGPVCKRFLEWSGTRLDQCVFVHDCVERKRGDLKLHRGGSASGHNGVRSLHESLRTRDFWRLRVGIGRPQVGTLHDYVLDQIDAAERRDFDSLFRSFIVEYLGKLEADLQASTSEQSVPAARGPVTPHAP